MPIPGRIKNFLLVSNANLQLKTVEEASFSINAKGELESLWLKGKILYNSAKKLGNLEALLSNAHKILAFKKIAAKETNFITNRNIIFAANQGQNELIEYDVDPSFINIPIKISATYDTDGKDLILSLQVENCLDHSKIMGNTIRNVKLELPFSGNAESMNIEPFEEKGNVKFDRETNTLRWFVNDLEWRNRRKVVIKIHDVEKLLAKEIKGKKVKLSFLIPDRVLSQIIVDKVQLPGHVMRRDVQFDFKCETIGCNCTLDIVPAEIEAGEFTRLVEIYKEVKEEPVVYCGDEIKVVVKLRNCSDKRLRDISLYDEIPGGFELLRGENYWIGYLNPNETREIIYYIRSKIAGEYVLPSAKVTFKENDGRRNEISSKPCKIIIKALEKGKKYRICGNCGAHLPLEAKFCGKCGKRVK
jgi:hypothetical protein